MRYLHDVIHDMPTVTNTDTPRSESVSKDTPREEDTITKFEETKSYFALASPKSVGAISPRSADFSFKSSELSPLSPTSSKSAEFSPKFGDFSPKSLDYSPKRVEKSPKDEKSWQSLNSRTSSAINNSFGSKLTKSSKTDKAEKTKLLSSVSESLRRDAKFPSGKQVKAEDKNNDDDDDVFTRRATTPTSHSKSDDEQGILCSRDQILYSILLL